MSCAALLHPFSTPTCPNVVLGSTSRCYPYIPHARFLSAIQLIFVSVMSFLCGKNMGDVSQMKKDIQVLKSTPLSNPEDNAELDTAIKRAEEDLHHKTRICALKTACTASSIAIMAGLFVTNFAITMIGLLGTIGSATVLSIEEEREKNRSIL